MEIHNVRIGFATNSSSSHSLVFLPDNVKEHDDYEPGQFDWSFFTLSSEEAKRSYLSIILWNELIRNMPRNVANMVCKKWVKHIPKDVHYIDHESIFSLPSDYYFSKIPDEQFFFELCDFITQSNLCILGGNNNDSEQHRLAKHGNFELPFSGDLTCRKDPGGYWTIFNRDNGRKIRFSFSQSKDMIIKPDKAFAPELIDIKITDACSKGCRFCYQDSVPSGRHCSDVDRLIGAISKLKVFEVAIGGGEPTSHPDFADIVSRFREAGIVPNFSTRSLDWIRNDKIWPTVIDHCGKFAFSTEKLTEAEEFLNLVESKGVEETKYGFHLIVGIIEPWQYEQIMELAYKRGASVTMLGYKDVGRGAKRDLKYYESERSWLDHIIEMRNKGQYVTVGIDTVLAKKHCDDLKESGIPGILYETEEGKFSCYIDAVNMKIGPSSFCTEDQMIDLDPLNWKDDMSTKIKEAFAKF